MTLKITALPKSSSLLTDLIPTARNLKINKLLLSKAPCQDLNTALI